MTTTLFGERLTKGQLWAARTASSYHRQIEEGQQEPMLPLGLEGSEKHFMGGIILDSLRLRVVEYYADATAPNGDPVSDFRIEPRGSSPVRGDSALMR